MNLERTSLATGVGNVILKEAPEESKPYWYPLRGLPEKANHPNYCDNGRYDKGQDDCIEEILGG